VNRSASAVLRGRVRQWLVAILVSLGFLLPGAVVTWFWPGFALIEFMVGGVLGSPLTMFYLYKVFGSSLLWLIPLVLWMLSLSGFFAVQVPATLLSHRGQVTDAVVSKDWQEADGSWSCSFSRPDGTPIPYGQGECTSFVSGNGSFIGARTRLLYDPRGQVEPAPARGYRAANVGEEIVIGAAGVALLVLTVAGAALTGEYWVRRHPRPESLEEIMLSGRGTVARRLRLLR
jgi:hypothetical protein